MPKLLFFRRKLFRYRTVEQALAQQPNVRRMLDVGCGDGENLSRFNQLPICRVGIDTSYTRLRVAKKRGQMVAQANGCRLPFPDQSFDLVYVAHVLHHAVDWSALLTEIGRCLARTGKVFVVETVSDSPLLRLGRAIRPKWRGDRVAASWRYDELTRLLPQNGFRIEASERYNMLFFLWELLPLMFWPFEILTPFFVYLDLALERLFGKYAAHAYFVLAHERDAAAR